jgi:NADH-quinone oxidoreductase subunit M
MGLFALNKLGVEGSILQMVNHGISTGALFILLGFLYTRRHTYEISSLKGIAKSAPVFAGLFTLVMLSSIGLPGLNGFVGEFMILLGTFMAHRWWAVVATAGVIIAALYLLWAYQRVFHGEPDEANASFPDLNLSERLVMIPLIALIVFLGVYPKPVLDRIEPSVNRVLSRMEEKVDRYNEPDTQAGSGLDLLQIEKSRESAENGDHAGTEVKK